MKFSRLLLSTLALILSACGGGGSSSSGDSSSAGNNQFAGTYSGDHTVTLSAAGESFQETVFLSMTVNGDGSFRIVDEDGDNPVVGNLNGNNFDGSGSASTTIDGVSCNVTENYSGTIGDNVAKGNHSGSGTCSESGVSIDITFSGPFNLPKTGNAKRANGASIMSKAAALLK